MHPRVLPAAGLLMGLLLVLMLAGLRVNLTASAPRGLWWRTALAPDAQLHRGAWVLIRPTPYLTQLTQLLGMGHHELLKQAVVFPGETWCIEEHCQAVAPGEVVVWAAHPRSFDSRVFGPVPREAIVATARPVLTWGGMP